MKAKLSCAVSLLSLTTIWAQTSFIPGNLAVLQVGDGSTPLGTAGAPLFVDEFGLDPGSLVQQITIPATGSGLTLGGSTTTEGALTLSSDGTFLTFGGYMASAGTAGISSSTVPRAVGVINHLGSFSVTASTSGSLAFSGGSVSSAISDGHNYWMSGTAADPANGGIWSSTGAGAPTQVSAGSLRNARISNGNLGYTTGSGTPGVYQFAGVPTGAATASSLFAITSPLPGPNAFAISPDGNTAYVADDGGFLSRGVQKWVNNGGTWTLAYRLAVGGNAGTRQLTVEWGANPIIFATTSELVSNRVVEVFDNGSAASSTVTTLDTAAANTLYRGVDFAPIPEPSTVAVLALGLAAFGLYRKRSV